MGKEDREDAGNSKFRVASQPASTTHELGHAVEHTERYAPSCVGRRIDS